MFFMAMALTRTWQDFSAFYWFSPSFQTATSVCYFMLFIMFIFAINCSGVAASRVFTKQNKNKTTKYFNVSSSYEIITNDIASLQMCTYLKKVAYVLYYHKYVCTLFSSYSSNAYKTLDHKSFSDSFFTRINCNIYYDATGKRMYALVTSHIPTMYIVYVQQHCFGGRRKRRAHGDLVEAVEKRVTSRQPQPPSRLEAYTFYRPPSQDLQSSKYEKEHSNVNFIL